MTGQVTSLWRETNSAIFGPTIAAAAEQLGILELAAEKDYWACEALRAIESHAPSETIFKGGTSLEKMRLINRFSEDLDLLVPGNYGGAGPTKRALGSMCAAAASALPGCEPERVNSGGNPGSMHRAVYLAAPLAGVGSATGIADPTRILLELGQSGGQHPSVRRPVVSLLARALDEAGVTIADFPDLAPFEVRMLHPGRTLIEKLLRVNNFAADEKRREKPQGWPRIGRQFYDIWALLGDAEVLGLLTNRDLVAQIVADCTRISSAFAPDLPPPLGGFAACAAFDPNWPDLPRLRAEHETAMRNLYYGRTPAPGFDDVLDRVHEHRKLLDVTTGLH